MVKLVLSERRCFYRAVSIEVVVILVSELHTSGGECYSPIAIDRCDSATKILCQSWGTVGFVLEIRDF